VNPADVDFGWRFWMLTEDGWLGDPFTTANAGDQYRPGAERRWMPERIPTCDNGAGHTPPVPRCGCGIHYLPDAAWCVDFVSIDGTVAGDAPFWRRPVFGTVKVTGATRLDLEPGVYRGARGVVDADCVLNVPHSLADEAPRLRERYGCEVVVSGRSRGEGRQWAGALAKWTRTRPPLPRPVVPDEVTGWRWWGLNSNGRLSSLYRWPYPWWPSSGYTATCPLGDHDFDRAPVEGCRCGARLHPSLPDLLDGMRAEPFAAGLREWEQVSDGYPAYRAQQGVTDVPDVIGEVVGWGARADTATGDVEGTLRFQYARPGRVLYVSKHLAKYAHKLQRTYPDAVVHVGRTRGLDWLREIERNRERAA
jgi:hypothetical protein